jgi:hypothetical protein
MSNAGGGAAVPPVSYADIIFADNVLDPAGGNPKSRRVIVITPDAELAAGYPSVAVGVTGSLQNITADHVLTPYKNPPGTRHPVTGTVKKSAALCTWLVIVAPADISGLSGHTPPASMLLIQQKAGAAAKVLGGWP